MSHPPCLPLLASHFWIVSPLSVTFSQSLPCVWHATRRLAGLPHFWEGTLFPFSRAPRRQPSRALTPLSVACSPPCCCRSRLPLPDSASPPLVLPLPSPGEWPPAAHLRPLAARRRVCTLPWAPPRRPSLHLSLALLTLAPSPFIWERVSRLQRRGGSWRVRPQSSPPPLRRRAVDAGCCRPSARMAPLQREGTCGPARAWRDQHPPPPHHHSFPPPPVLPLICLASTVISEPPPLAPPADHTRH